MTKSHPANKITRVLAIKILLAMQTLIMLTISYVCLRDILARVPPFQRVEGVTRANMPRTQTFARGAQVSRKSIIWVLIWRGLLGKELYTFAETLCKNGSGEGLINPKP